MFSLIADDGHFEERSKNRSSSRSQSRTKLVKHKKRKNRCANNGVFFDVATHELVMFFAVTLRYWNEISIFVIVARSPTHRHSKSKRPRSSRRRSRYFAAKLLSSNFVSISNICEATTVTHTKLSHSLHTLQFTKNVSGIYGKYFLHFTYDLIIYYLPEQGFSTFFLPFTLCQLPNIKFIPCLLFIH